MNAEELYADLKTTLRSDVDLSIRKKVSCNIECYSSDNPSEESICFKKSKNVTKIPSSFPDLAQSPLSPFALAQAQHQVLHDVVDSHTASHEARVSSAFDFLYGVFCWSRPRPPRPHSSDLLNESWLTFLLQLGHPPPPSYWPSFACLVVSCLLSSLRIQTYLLTPYPPRHDAIPTS